MDNTNENINVNFESHIKIIDKTTKNNPKMILSARLFNIKSLINNEEGK